MRKERKSITGDRSCIQARRPPYGNGFPAALSAIHIRLLVYRLQSVNANCRLAIHLTQIESLDRRGAPSHLSPSRRSSSLIAPAAGLNTHPALGSRSNTIGLVFLLVMACAPSSLSGQSTPNLGEATAAGASALEGYLQQREVETRADTGGVYRPFIAVFPFRDDSGFPDDFWDLENDIARLLAAEMAVERLWHIVPFDAVAEAIAGSPERSVDVSTFQRPMNILRRLFHMGGKPVSTKGDPQGAEEELYEAAKVLGADIVLYGTLLDLNMERFSVGDPLLGGYKSYRGITEVELKAVRVADQSTVGNLYSRRETTDRGLGLDLLGKPRDKDQQFANLRDMAFGSEEFRATGIGQATLAAMAELIGKLAGILKPRGITMPEGGHAEVLSVNGGEIFVNIGSENGVYVGQRFSIMPAPERALTQNLAVDTPVSVVQVQDVIGGRVSRARALYGAALVVTGDHLQPIEANLP